MNFGISDNSCMFADDSDQESFSIIDMTAIFMLLSDVPYLKNKLLKSPRIAVCLYTQLVLGRIREASSFLCFINFKFHTLMTKNRENLNEGTNVASLSSTQPSETGKSQSKLEKEIVAIQKKVATLQAECKTYEAEKYRLLCYIDRYCSCLLSNFLENNPLDSRDWKKLHKLQLDVKEAIK